jgi:uncharacterized protein (DUF362 family)
MNNDVFIVRTEPHYPVFPYDSDDRLLQAFRSLFAMWGKDPENPFAEWIGPGARVVIKPNWVCHDNPYEKNLDALVTHSSLIKHLIDFMAVALNGHGSIIIGDSPIQSCDFQVLVKRTRIAEVVELARKKYSGLDIRIEDWRLTLFEGRAGAQKHRPNYEALVSKDYEVIDLGQDSFLEDISDYSDRFRVTCYDPHLMASHHHKGKHEYLVTRKVFDADLLIDLAKMKTHIKAGLTGALKNLVGINGHKEFLPHHILGSSDRGGDCYYKDNSLRRLYDVANDKFWTRYYLLSNPSRRAGAIILGAIWRASRILTGDSISAGSWQGNETVWRMTLDLNHLLYFAKRAPKKIISIVDGVIAGEGEGPLRPTAKAVGLLVAGENPAYVDATLAKLMGYNVSRVPTIYHAIYHRKSRFGGPYLEDVKPFLAQNGSIQSVPFCNLMNLGFITPEHWKRAASEYPKTITGHTKYRQIAESA